MNITLYLQTRRWLCTVCGGAKLSDDASCVLKCHRMPYEASRLRQYTRAYKAGFWTDPPEKIEYNLRRIAQYKRNLADRARKAFAVRYYSDGCEPDRLWVKGRVA